MSQHCFGFVKLCHGNVKSIYLVKIYYERNPDSEIKKFIGDDDANKFLIPQYRAPWVLPKI